jgi:hypothetical protein
MTLPKVKNKKLIKKSFVSVAKQVKQSIQEEIEYINEKKMKNEHNLSSYFNINS